MRTIPLDTVVDASEEALTSLRKAWEADTRKEAQYFIEEAAAFLKQIREEATVANDVVLQHEYRQLVLSY